MLPKFVLQYWINAAWITTWHSLIQWSRPRYYLPCVEAYWYFKSLQIAFLTLLAWHDWSNKITLFDVKCIQRSVFFWLRWLKWFKPRVLSFYNEPSGSGKFLGLAFKITSFSKNGRCFKNPLDFIIWLYCYEIAGPFIWDEGLKGTLLSLFHTNFGMSWLWRKSLWFAAGTTRKSPLTPCVSDLRNDLRSCPTKLP